MTTQSNNWAATRIPCLGAMCASICQKTYAPNGAYFEVFPFLIAVTAAFLTLSGVVMAVYYNPWHAFQSVQFIDRNVNNGWLIHAYHATGTTMIFAVTYLFLFRAILTRSYRAPGEFVWMLSVKLLAVLLLTGWLGYVMTGGAAGYWSLFNAANAALSLGGLPGAVGLWFFGGPAGSGTLARLEIFHALLAVSLLLVVWMLHAARKTIARPVAPARAVAFYPYYVAQYFAALAVFAFIFAILAFYAPHLGTSHANLIPSSSLAVPVDAGVPWYLAPAAGLFGIFPSAGLSILAAIAAAAVLYALPWLDRSGPSGNAALGERIEPPRSRLYGFFIWILALDVLLLGIAADSSCASPILAGICTAWFFFHFLVITPVVTAMEAE